jgi:hypothetical protein
MARIQEREERMKASYPSANNISWTAPSYSQPAFGSKADGNNNPAVPTMPCMGSYQPDLSSQNHPATLAGTVKSMIWLGVIIAVGYAYFSLHLKSWPEITVFAIEGVLIGAALGVALYVAIMVLRWVITVAAAIIQFAFSCCIVIGGLYLLSKFF